MPIKWKHTTVKTPGGEKVITHWDIHDPRRILESLEGTAESVGSTPPVFIHTFGKHRLAVRTFPHSGVEVPAQVLFDRLQKLHAKQSEVLETPVFMVEQGPNVQIGTVWEKKHIPLDAFLSSSVSIKLKEKAAKSAIRQIAKLQALRIAHGHLGLNNFIVDPKGRSKLIDYTRLGKFNHQSEEREGIDVFPHHFSKAIYPQDAHDAVAARLKLRGKLKETYLRQLARSREANAKRGIEPFETEKRK